MMEEANKGRMPVSFNSGLILPSPHLNRVLTENVTRPTIIDTAKDLPEFPN